MDKLQWFKFSHTDWMMGKIQRCPEITQARFIRLCCLYWNKETNLSYDDAVIEIDKKHLDILIDKKIISTDDAHIYIDFLDEQMYNILETSRKNSKAGKISAQKRAEKKQQLLNDRSTTVQRNPTDKIREDKKRKDNKHQFDSDEYKKQLWNYIREFASKHKLDIKKVQDVSIKAYDYYKELGWKNSKGKEIKNLKLTITSNWFKDLEEFRANKVNTGGDVNLW